MAKRYPHQEVRGPQTSLLARMWPYRRRAAWGALAVFVPSALAGCTSSSTASSTPWRPTFRPHTVEETVGDCNVKTPYDYERNLDVSLRGIEGTRLGDGTLRISGHVPLKPPFDGVVVRAYADLISVKTGKQLDVQNAASFVPPQAHYEARDGKLRDWIMQYDIPGHIADDNGAFLVLITLFTERSLENLSQTGASGDYTSPISQAVLAFDKSGKRIAVPARLQRALLNRSQMRYAIDGCTVNPDGSVRVSGTVGGWNKESSEFGQVDVSTPDGWSKVSFPNRAGQWQLTVPPACVIRLTAVAGSNRVPANTVGAASVVSVQTDECKTPPDPAATTRDVISKTLPQPVARDLVGAAL